MGDSPVFIFRIRMIGAGKYHSYKEIEMNVDFFYYLDSVVLKVAISSTKNMMMQNTVLRVMLQIDVRDTDILWRDSSLNLDLLSSCALKVIL